MSPGWSAWIGLEKSAVGVKVFPGVVLEVEEGGSYYLRRGGDDAAAVEGSARSRRVGGCGEGR